MPKQKPPSNPLSSPGSSHLERLISRAEQHRVMESLILDALPEQLAGDCRFGGYKNGEITLIVANSTQASQLRFQQRQILAKLREHEALRQAWRIRVRVGLWSAAAPRQAKGRPRLSKKNARLLEEVAGHTEDQGLRTVLLRLASRGETDDGDQNPA